ncbi:MAG: sigma 54-interacting transcriptional regulator, partial [Candidatus Hydrogenedentes bacterium]|nr:sigma 54-interacting transcriptional regulator [Candidatus Hydrogenedentota bacterium]
RFEMGDIVSRSPNMQRLFDILPQVAASNSTVLIQGETGTGKELLARAIHHLSPRKDKPFVAINCGALPDSLLESELFGYKKGAFTGAERDKPGRFALADGGTLLLDEIGDISPALQVRLLRVLQERCYEPLGSIESVSANVRVITATNKDLATLVESNNFRSDLFYRINVVRMELPPLRKRKEDIPLLVERFIVKLNHLQGRTVSDVTPEVMETLMMHSYPGNIRELENIIEHAFVLCTSKDTIGSKCLPEHLHTQSAAIPPRMPLSTAVQTTEAQVILETLHRNKGNRLATARELGMHKSTLFRKIKTLGIQPPKKSK